MGLGDARCRMLLSPALGEGTSAIVTDGEMGLRYMIASRVIAWQMYDFSGNSASRNAFRSLHSMRLSTRI